jgi:dihydroorotase
MTLYLTEGTDPADVAEAHTTGLVTAVKLYPAGATTNSHSGVRDLDKVIPVLEKNGRDRHAAVHSWRSHQFKVDIFDREAAFIETVLDPLRKRLPDLRITLEHVTTSDGIDYVSACPAKIWLRPSPPIT